ncbi:MULTISPECIES: ABC transporter permease [unclassified Cryobacterium]|uniref:ABC transporter permease n=1 Tax=unclassified Cryobacterium TaxID=2649013 RepID=UPI000CE51977|nr:MULTISPECIES: ABC transporter permease [unclassified Cryobacterium]
MLRFEVFGLSSHGQGQGVVAVKWQRYDLRSVFQWQPYPRLFVIPGASKRSASAVARAVFRVVQFMPALVFSQILLGGIFLPREQLPEVLRAISDGLPLSHAIDALRAVADDSHDAA